MASLPPSLRQYSRAVERNWADAEGWEADRAPSKDQSVSNRCFLVAERPASAEESVAGVR